MNHAYIDGNKVAEAYLRHTLPAEERAQFESHMVDCEECRDRLLLAEMFHARNGALKALAREPVEAAVAESAPEPIQIHVSEPAPAPRLPQRARFVAWLRPWQIWVILIAAALLLVLVPTAAVLFTR